MKLRHWPLTESDVNATPVDVWNVDAVPPRGLGVIWARYPVSCRTLEEGLTFGSPTAKTVVLVCVGADIVS